MSAEQSSLTSSAADQAEVLRRMERAENYNAWLLERARPFLGRRVLDAGAGTGTFTELVAVGRELVVALEPEEGFALLLEERFAGEENVKVVAAEAGAFSPELLPSQVDSVLCFNVLEHIADDARAMRWFREVLVPGGRLLLLVPAHPFLFGATDRLVGHERRYRVRDLSRRLAEAGFAVDDVRYVNPLGALGWLASSKLMRRALLPERSLGLYDRLVPILRHLDRLPIPFGLSVWAVARRDGESEA